MLLSYEYLNLGAGSINKDGIRISKYRIIDSEFKSVGVSEYGLGIIAVHVSDAVIDTYGSRNLNVAANLIRVFIWASEQQFGSVSDNVRWAKLYNPRYAKYETEINKYLMLV